MNNSPAGSLSAAVTRLKGLLPEAVFTQVLEKLPLWTQDVSTAVTNAERWLEAYAAEEGQIPPIDQDLDWLLPVWASGAFLPRLMVRRPWLFDRFREGPPDAGSKSPEEYLTEVLARTALVTDAAMLASVLRAYKYEQIFSIGARDLAGRLALPDVTAELTSLAAACCEAAYRHHWQTLKEAYGQPADATAGPAGFVILAMGKMGGLELNFSSDIDLIYLFEEEGETTGGTEGNLSHREFFTKLASRISAAINDVTEDGFVFRVDLRLRPEGNHGPLVNSLAAGEGYYANWGQTWERSALLKARAVAGDISLGESFLEALSPFIYRRFLDYSTVEDIKLMKQKIDVNLARTSRGAWDVKLGQGGIREIEFIVQTEQLIHAGKQKALRTRSTLDGLRRLEELRLLMPEDAAALSSAYVFYRRLEHRLQIENERQTQLLADDDATHLRMARLLMYHHADPATATAAFRNDLLRHREAVQDMFRRLFTEPGEEIEQVVNPAVLAVTEGEGNVPERLEAVANLGFNHPEAALESMRRLVGASQTRRLDGKSRRYLERLMPAFLSECAASPDPDLALTHLEDFMQHAGGFQAYHSLLAENPATLKLLVRLFGTSPFLSRFFIRHPELLDQLVLSSYATSLKDAARMGAELRRAMDELDPEDEEAALDTLRRFKNTEMLRVAMNDVEGQLDLIEVTTQLADLADVILRAAMALAASFVERRYGAVPGAELVILGMGKFGGHEMNYSSDLDLIFIYTGSGVSQGERSVSLPEYFAKFVQRLISALTLVTREGMAYPIDARLRPSGKAGPLVTSMESFEAYHQSSAAIWERQALIRARPIVGSPETAGHIREILDHAIYERPFSERDVNEILRVRERMEHEIEPETPRAYNIKTGRGGIVDIEFLVQILQLRHGGDYHSLRKPNTYVALAELRELNLIEAPDYSLLREGYLFLRRLENRMRVLHDAPRSDLSKDPLEVEKLALSVGYKRGPVRGEAGQALLTEFVAVRERIRAVFMKYFET
jgi:[glutamine synthetase] adenylyltransferase / [glutamine synthetase]-adenylyl-L-tyrosine phosphorylase